MNSSKLWWTRMSPNRMLKALDAMNNSRLWVTWATLGHELWLWMLWRTQGIVKYERIGIPWAQTSICYEQLKLVDDMNDSWSWAMALNFMNCIGLWMTWTTLGSELRALDATNNSGLWLTWTTPSCELSILDVINSLKVWMTWTTLGRELRSLILWTT